MNVGDVVRVVYPENYRRMSYLGHLADYLPVGSTGVIDKTPKQDNIIPDLYSVKFFACPDELFYVESKWLELVE